MVDALAARQLLQLAVAVGHAHGADVVALRQQQLQDHRAGSSTSFGVDVRTTIPSPARVTQAGNSAATTASSTRHSRHAPTSDSAVEVAQRRDSTPFSRATSSSVWPSWR